jgi:DNA-binding transcriptional ArsR family regulator
MDNFWVASETGWVNCSLQVDEVSLTECEFDLLSAGPIYMNFTTADFVKSLADKFYFSADFSLHQAIDYVLTSIRLPQGMVLGDILTYPDNVTLLSDGRHIIAVWDLSNVSPHTPLKFELTYQPTEPPSPLAGYVGVTFLAIVLTGLALGTLYWRRGSKKLILSVLDESERRVLQLIIADGGTTRQKRLVRELGFSKAKVSRVVKALAERGLLKVERVGRTNRLRLTKRFW